MRIALFSALVIGASVSANAAQTFPPVDSKLYRCWVEEKALFHERDGRIVEAHRACTLNFILGQVISMCNTKAGWITTQFSYESRGTGVFEATITSDPSHPDAVGKTRMYQYEFKDDRLHITEHEPPTQAVPMGAIKFETVSKPLPPPADCQVSAPIQ